MKNPPMPQVYRQSDGKALALSLADLAKDGSPELIHGATAIRGRDDVSRVVVVIALDGAMTVNGSPVYTLILAEIVGEWENSLQWMTSASSVDAIRSVGADYLAAAPAREAEREKSAQAAAEWQAERDAKRAEIYALVVSAVQRGDAKLRDTGTNSVSETSLFSGDRLIAVFRHWGYRKLSGLSFLAISSPAIAADFIGDAAANCGSVASKI